MNTVKRIAIKLGWTAILLAVICYGAWPALLALCGGGLGCAVKGAVCLVLAVAILGELND